MKGTPSPDPTARSRPLSRSSRTQPQPHSSESPASNEPPPETSVRELEHAGSASADVLGPSLELLAKVRSGAHAGPMLAPGDRQALVSLLASDGLSKPKIAQILHVADRTIERECRAIRTALSVPKDLNLVEQMVGRLMAEAELTVQRIRRTAREREVDSAVKIDAEHRCFQIVRDLVQSLQKLGYLPTATQMVEADLTHHVGELPSLTNLKAEIKRLRLVEGGDSSGSALMEVEQIKADLQCLLPCLNQVPRRQNLATKIFRRVRQP